MMKLTRLVVLALGLSSVSPALYAAGSAVSSDIVRIGTGPYFEKICGFACAVIQVSPPPEGRADCHYSKGDFWDFAFNTSTQVGQQMYQQILAAHMNGKKLGFKGSGLCITGKTYEELIYTFTPM